MALSRASVGPIVSLMARLLSILGPIFASLAQFVLDHLMKEP